MVKGKRKGGLVAVDYTYMYDVIHVRRNLSCPVLNSGRIEYTTLLIRKKRKREGKFNISIRLFSREGPNHVSLDAWERIIMPRFLFSPVSRTQSVCRFSSVFTPLHTIVT